MKKVLFVILVFLMGYAEEIKISTTEVYENGYAVNTNIRVLCIDGYKWLLLDSSKVLSQMFEEVKNELPNVKYGYLRATVPVKCKK